MALFIFKIRPVARLRLKEPGNAFYVNYRKLSKQVMETRKDTARKNATPEEAAKLAAAEAEKKGGNLWRLLVYEFVSRLRRSAFLL